jgi:hypothetical protein
MPHQLGHSNGWREHVATGVFRLKGCGWFELAQTLVFKKYFDLRGYILIHFLKIQYGNLKQEHDDPPLDFWGNFQGNDHL